MTGHLDQQRRAEALEQAFCRDQDLAPRGSDEGDSAGTILSRLLLRVVPVLILLVLLDLLLRRFLPQERLLPYMDDEIASYTLLVDNYVQRPAPDVLFLGSSRMRDAVDPTLFAELLSQKLGRPASAFNLALGGAEAEELHAIATSHVPDPPPCVVLGFSGAEVGSVHRFRFASRFLWNFDNLVDYLRRTSPTRLEVKHVEYFIEQSICAPWYLFRHRDPLSAFVWQGARQVAGIGLTEEELKVRAWNRERLLPYVLSPDGHQELHPQGKPLSALIEENPLHGAVLLRGRELNRDPGFFDAAAAHLLERTVTVLRERGSSVILVETPTSPHMQEYNDVLYGEYFRDRISELAAHLDVPFIPFRPSESGLTDYFYQDRNHLSAKGARRYTQLLFQALSDNGLFEVLRP